MKAQLSHAMTMYMLMTVGHVRNIPTMQFGEEFKIQCDNVLWGTLYNAILLIVYV